jgi:subtilisin family serine protease
MKNFFFLLSFILSINLFAQAKLTPRLEYKLNNMSNIEYLRVLCLLKDRVDIEELDKFLYDIKATPQQRAYIVITTLQEKANSTQSRLINYLNAKLNSGEVKQFQSFWITNLIMVEANKNVIMDLAGSEEIELMDFDAILQLDPYVNEGPAPENTEGSEIGLRVINADKLWKMGITGEGKLVMNIDTGVEGSHPALNSRWRGNFVPANQAWFDPETNTTFPTDCDDHGTHTMGIMTGRAGTDTIGVAPNAQWIAAKTICSSPHTSKSIAAFQWAMNPDGNPNTITDMPDVISNSWYDPDATDECTGIYKQTFDALEAAGIAIVFSAGNNGPGASTITKPKNINTNEVNVFAVGNINGNTSGYPIASSSSRGPSTCGGTGSLLIKPEVVAPGTSVRSSVRGGGYSTMSGTSMASPHVAGAIALLKQVFPDLTGTQLKYALYNTAVDLGDPGEDNTYGKGLIDVYAAFLYLANRDSVPPTQITNLQVSEIGSNHIKLSWTAPFDNSPGGVVEYDIRYSTSGPILDTVAFNNAVKVLNTPNPDSAGRPQSILIDKLAFNTTYYFAIRSRDVWNNWSPISNNVSGTTLSKPVISVNPDSLNLIKPANITFQDSVRIFNNSSQPSTLQFNVSLQNHTFPTKSFMMFLQPDISEEANENKLINKSGNGFSILGSGGPDQFGYRWKDSREPNGPRFSWSTISDLGTPITLTDDSYSTQTLNFQFPFYGTNYSSVEVVSNGYLRFTNFSSTYPTNGTIPSTAAPNNAIYGFWDDLNPGSGGNVYVYKTADKFIVEFNNVPRYNDATTRVTFQIEIQKSGTIIYRYLRMVGTLNSATIGIENATGTDGLLIAYNQTYVSDSLLVKIQKEPDWLSVNNVSGIISNGNSMSVKLLFNTNELINGNYRMEMNIAHNDSARSNLIIPINLTITDTTYLITSTINVNSGWNLISVPIQTLQVRKDELFPSSNSFAYGYSTNYVIKDTLHPGFGYWLKFPTGQNIQLIGNGLTTLSVPLRNGWNLIGSLNGSIPVSSLITNPPNIISGYIYGYTNNYFVANTLEKGKGYWVKSTANGTLTLNLTGAKISSIDKIDLEKFNWSVLEFSNGKSSSKLYLGKTEKNLETELPPIPPFGNFDVRFINNSFVSDLSDANLISIITNDFPVSITLRNSNGKSYQITDAINQQLFNQILTEGKTITIDNPLIDKLLLKEWKNTLSYELMQNYPNPFNPKTVIQFIIPEKVFVNLSVYNSIGEKVAELINKELEAGIHQVDFDGSTLSSGIYFYKLSAGNFNQIKKLTLIK